LEKIMQRSSASSTSSLVTRSALAALGLVGLAFLACACEQPSASDLDPAEAEGGGGRVGAGDERPNAAGEPANTASGSCAITNNITKPTTWSKEACPNGYHVRFMIDVVGSGVKLEVRPGTKVRVANGASITVRDGATLAAQGAADDPIVFEGMTGAPGSWAGLRIKTNSPSNRLAHAIVRHAGGGELRAALSLSEMGRIALSDTVISDNAKVGLALFDEASLASFDRVALLRNGHAAAQVGVPHVKYLNGEEVTILDNGLESGIGNAVLVEATSLLKLTEDATWPSVAPAVYRIGGQGGQDSGIVEVEAHLDIEPGAVFEMTSGSGFLVAGGAAGLRAVGTEGHAIVFRGVDESSWTGITFGESSWSENRLEHVEVRGAFVAPKWGYYGTGNTSTRKAGILLGYNVATPVQLSLKNFTVIGPNNAPADVAVKRAAVLHLGDGVVGTGDGGKLVLQAL
jgi:hypothetical protein